LIPVRYDLVIFDCDGVLVDSEPIANRVLADQLNAVGLSLSYDEVLKRFVGRTRADCLALAAELRGRDLPEAFGKEWDAALFDALRAEVKAIEGVPELTERLELPYCVASNSSPERMTVSLRASGLHPFFEGRMFSAAAVSRPKPAPDLFLHAARSMGVAPDRCAVIEDTPTGVRAAVAAGMTAFGYVIGAGAAPVALRAEGAIVFQRMNQLADMLIAPN
jgi:HAD superfamily hydrolase (TIGR01509 family)